VVLGQEAAISELLSFYMGKNTPDRQQYIINNLKVEKDAVEDTEPA
jgi:topoisomerase-4 subunit B